MIFFIPIYLLGKKTCKVPTGCLEKTNDHYAADSLVFPTTKSWELLL